jgi:hypothetical protein
LKAVSDATDGRDKCIERLGIDAPPKTVDLRTYVASNGTNGKGATE